MVVQRRDGPRRIRDHDDDDDDDDDDEAWGERRARLNAYRPTEFTD